MRGSIIDGPGRRSALFVHGAGGGGWEWAIWQRVFAARGWRCAAPDLQPAASGLAATRLEDYAAQVKAWARDADAGVWIGASLGGLLALTCAQTAAPIALVLVNAMPPAAIIGSVAGVEYAEIVPWRSRRSLASTLRAMPDADAAARLYAFRHWRDESGAALAAATRGVALERPACATLVLASADDAAIAATASRRLAEWLGAEFRCLRGTSHVGPLLGRRAAQTARDVVDWLEGTLPPAR